MEGPTSWVAIFRLLTALTFIFLLCFEMTTMDAIATAMQVEEGPAPSTAAAADGGQADDPVQRRGELHHFQNLGTNQIKEPTRASKNMKDTDK